MSELENTTEGVNVTTEQTVPTTIEDRAKEQGWRPKEEYEGDPDKWVSAETFIAKGELIERIESLGKELKNTKKAMTMLQEHHQRVKETEFKNAVAYLKAQKKEAYEKGDVDAIIDIDEKLAEVKETQKAQREALQEENVPHEFQEWVSKNKWYDQYPDLKETADDIGIAYANRTKKPPQEVLEYVEKQIKRMYPEKFTNPNRSKTSPVEGSGNKGVTKLSEDITLSDEERQVMNNFIRSGIMTKEDYIRDLKLIRGQ